MQLHPGNDQREDAPMRQDSSPACTLSHLILHVGPYLDIFLTLRLDCILQMPRFSHCPHKSEKLAQKETFSRHLH